MTPVEDKFLLQTLNIISPISKSNSQVYLVTREGHQDFAILKKYKQHIESDTLLKIASLDSEYFPRIDEIWTEDGYLCVLEEYIDGKTLREVMDTGLSQDMLLHIMNSLCDALLILHRQTPPVIHRDIKPDNILISRDGTLKLIDFDASREYKDGQTRDTVILGTREYASPEQYGFRQTDVRADVYSTGIILSELLSHTPALKNARRYQTVVKKATMFAPADRYQSISDFKKALNFAKRNSRRTVLPVASGVAGIIVIAVLITVAALNHFGFFQSPGNRILSVESSEQSADSEYGPTEANSGIADFETTSDESIPTEANALCTALTFSDLMASLPEVPAEDDTSLYDELVSKKTSVESDDALFYFRYIGDDYDDYLSKQVHVPESNLLTFCFDLGNIRPIIFYDTIYLEEKPKAHLTPYKTLETGELEDKYISIPSGYLSVWCGNCIISEQFLQTLDPGYYLLEVETISRYAPICLIVHDNSEDTSTCLPFAYGGLYYYSSELQNDLFIYTNNNLSPLETVLFENKKLPDSAYTTVCNGYGLFLTSEQINALAAQTDDNIDLYLKMTDGKPLLVRIALLNNYED